MGWLVFWAVILLTSFAGFLALGTWQVQRMYWKHALIDRVDHLLQAAPVDAPGLDAWPALSNDQDEYRRIELQGVLLDHDILVQANTRLGAGFWVMTPLRRPDGSHVFINRGFVDAAHRDRARMDPVPGGPVRIQGLLRMSQPGGGFLRANVPAEHRWYSRDTAAMGAALHLAPVAPYFVDQSDGGPLAVTVGDDDELAALAVSPAHWPVSGLTVVHFRDQHLSYALTWYALALMTAAAIIYGLRQERRRRRTGAHA